MLPLLSALLAGHGGLDAWRDIGEIRWEVEITKFSEDGTAADPVLWKVKFPTSGRAFYKGTLGGMEASYDHGEVVASDADLARYLLPTFNYIHSLPFKLADNGVRAEVPAESPCREGDRALKITFDPGIGDNPLDWYTYCVDGSDRMTSVLFHETHERNPGTFWLDFEGFEPVHDVWLPTALTYWATDDNQGRARKLKRVQVISVMQRPAMNR